MDGRDPPAPTIWHVAALLFDMDRTLVDSMQAIENGWRRWCAEYGVDFDELWAATPGRRSDDIIRQFLKHGDAARAAAAFTEGELSAAAGIRPVTGARELLTQLPAGRWTIVTSAARRLATRRLEGAGLPLPATLVTAEDVANGKPAPDGYLLAARRLGFAPRQCLVLEDAALGHEAARRAGIASLNVGPKAHQGSPALASVPDLASLSVRTEERGITITIKGR
jgi:mannitol-1-/sugar-/sorbitol-6-phosphatase